MKRTLNRQQMSTIVNGILAIVVIIVVLQLWIFTATMNAWLGGDDVVVVPAMIVSFVCLALNGGLLVYLYRLQR